MDEYLRSRYKKVEGGNSARPPRSRPVPARPERLHRQPARPMFPVGPRNSAPAQPPLTAHHASPTRPAQHPQPATASERLSPEPKQHITKRPVRAKRRFPFVKVLAAFLICGLAIGGSYYYLAYLIAPTALPQNLVESAGFAVYYPSKTTGSYKYLDGSANNQKGLFTYKLADGSNGAVITQQAKPNTNFNPSGLPNFKSINVISGTAVIGKSSGVMTVVYVTPTTLINMTTVNKITRADMIKIAQNLSPVKRETGLLKVFNIGFISSGIMVERAVYKYQ